MAATPSTMLDLGTTAPDFALPDVVTGETVRRDDFRDARALLVMFVCNHCPFVIHVRSELLRIGREYGQRGVAIVAISANDAEKYPDDAPAKMKELAERESWPFPYLYDETQEVAKAYRAACTPDFFLFDGDRELVYRGQLDPSRPQSDTPVTGGDLRRALDALLEGEEIDTQQVPSVGCNIKWKPGNAPEYHR